MQGSFSLGLIEILVSLFPGCILLFSIMYRFTSLPFDWITKNPWIIGAFLIVGFIIGQLLVTLSSFLVNVRIFVIKKIFKQKRIGDRYPFSTELRELLEKYYRIKLSSSDEYPFSLRLTHEYMPKSSAEADRLYAITMLARNLVFVFLAISIIYIDSNWAITIASFILSILFFIRYVDVEAVTGEIVSRSAFTYLVTLKANKNTKSKFDSN